MANTQSPSPNCHFNFMRLPREVRDEIYYYYYLKTPQQGHTLGNLRSPSTYPLPPLAISKRGLPTGLICVNHTIHDEAQEVFFLRFTFAWNCMTNAKVVHDFLDPPSGHVRSLTKSIKVHVLDYITLQEPTKGKLKEAFEVLVQHLPDLKDVELKITIDEERLRIPGSTETMLRWALDIASPFKKLNRPRALRAVNWWNSARGYEVVRQFNARIDAGTW